jgi:hypothetical protein
MLAEHPEPLYSKIESFRTVIRKRDPDFKTYAFAAEPSKALKPVPRVEPDNRISEAKKRAPDKFESFCLWFDKAQRSTRFGFPDIVLPLFETEDPEATFWLTRERPVEEVKSWEAREKPDEAKSDNSWEAREKLDVSKSDNNWEAGIEYPVPGDWMQNEPIPRFSPPRSRPRSPPRRDFRRRSPPRADPRRKSPPRRPLPKRSPPRARHTPKWPARGSRGRSQQRLPTRENRIDPRKPTIDYYNQKSCAAHSPNHYENNCPICGIKLVLEPDIPNLGARLQLWNGTNILRHTSCEPVFAHGPMNCGSCNTPLQTEWVHELNTEVYKPCPCASASDVLATLWKLTNTVTETKSWPFPSTVDPPQAVPEVPPYEPERHEIPSYEPDNPKMCSCVSLKDRPVLSNKYRISTTLLDEDCQNFLTRKNIRTSVEPCGHVAAVIPSDIGINSMNSSDGKASYSLGSFACVEEDVANDTARCFLYI